MSKIYHGSLEVVRSPEIRQSNRSLDYGTGFYATTSYEQAEKWVRRRMDDSVYTQFMLYEGGIIIMATLIRELKTYKLVDQYLFHTERALESIRFVEPIKIEL